VISDDGGLEQLRRELHDLAAAAPGADGEPVEGYGEAAEGLVRVVVENGRLTIVELDPRVMRLGAADLAEAFVAAANDALADLESKYPAMAYPAIDPAALEAQLAEVQEQSVRQMRQYNQSINDALRLLGP
jgi:hypothetical protein